jgi:hypothetical protein
MINRAATACNCMLDTCTPSSANLQEQEIMLAAPGYFVTSCIAAASRSTFFELTPAIDILPLRVM